MPVEPWTPLPDPDDALFIPLRDLTYERAPAIPGVAPAGLRQPRLVTDPQIPAADRRALVGLPPGDLIPLSRDVPQLSRGRRLRPWAALLSRIGVPQDEAVDGQLALAYHGRYLVPGVDLDNPARVLLARAQVVRAKVAAAAVAAAGLLDADAADALLAEQEWDIACTLYRQAQLRALHYQMTRGAGPATRQVQVPQLAALDESVTAVTRRVEALEKYARHIVDADVAYRDWRQSLELAGRNDDHRELRARTVRDEQGIEEIGGLSEQARLVERVLHASLRDAAHVAGTLVSGPASPSSRT